MIVLVNLTKGKVIAQRVEWAKNIMKRALGLMFRDSYDGALVFPIRGRSVFHGFFCRFPILLICLRNNRVVCKKTLLPWRVEEVWGDTVVEVDARKVVDVDVGDRVVILEDKSAE